MTWYYSFPHERHWRPSRPRSVGRRKRRLPHRRHLGATTRLSSERPGAANRLRPRPLLQGEVRAWCLASRVADAADCTNVLVLSRCWTARYSGPASSFCPTFLSARASSSCSRTSPLRLTQTATSPSTKTRSPTNSLQTLTARPGNSGRARLPLKWAARETALRAPRRTPARDPQCAGTGAAPKSHCLAGLWDCLRACFGNASGLSFGPQRAHTRPFTCGTRLQTCSI